jgi:hypothetical protein
MKKWLTLLLVLGVVFLSGCDGVGGVGRGSTNGLIISSFSVDPTEVYPGDTVYVTAEITNVGGAIANGISSGLQGLSLPQEGESPRDTQWQIVQEPTMPASLYPPEAGLEGESEVLEWELRAPNEQANDLSYDGEVDIIYSYATHTENLIRVANRDWIRTLPEDQKNTEMDKLG